MTTKQHWIAAVLLNDETSTGEEMRDYFIEQGLAPDEAEFYVRQRGDALLEGLYFKLRAFDARSRRAS
jgi:hypothetical protein